MASDTLNLATLSHETRTRLMRGIRHQRNLLSIEHNIYTNASNDFDQRRQDTLDNKKEIAWAKAATRARQDAQRTSTSMTELDAILETLISTTPPNVVYCDFKKDT